MYADSMPNLLISDSLIMFHMVWGGGEMGAACCHHPLCAWERMLGSPWSGVRLPRGPDLFLGWCLLCPSLAPSPGGGERPQDPVRTVLQVPMNVKGASSLQGPGHQKSSLVLLHFQRGDTCSAFSKE